MRISLIPFLFLVFLAPVKIKANGLYKKIVSKHLAPYLGKLKLEDYLETNFNIVAQSPSLD